MKNKLAIKVKIYDTIKREGATCTRKVFFPLFMQQLSYCAYSVHFKNVWFCCCFNYSCFSSFSTSHLQACASYYVNSLLVLCCMILMEFYMQSFTYYVTPKIAILNPPLCKKICSENYNFNMKRKSLTPFLLLSPSLYYLICEWPQQKCFWYFLTVVLWSYEKYKLISILHKKV